VSDDVELDDAAARHALEQAARRIAALKTDDLYVIWSIEHNRWWRADYCGYTDVFADAGRYPRAEAERIVVAGNIAAFHECMIPVTAVAETEDCDVAEKTDADRAHHDIAALQRRVDELERVCAEAYQFAGTVGAPERVLDNLLAGAVGQPIPHETILPVTAEECDAFRRNA